MSGHTPGPWWWEDSVAAEAGSPVQHLVNGRLAIVRHVCQSPVTDADARLIAEAPAMLEALRPFANASTRGEIDTVEKCGRTERERHAMRAAFAAARAILARLEGPDAMLEARKEER